MRKTTSIVTIEVGACRGFRVDSDVDNEALRRILDVVERRESENPGSQWRERLVGNRQYGHAEWISRPRADGAGDAKALSAKQPFVCFRDRYSGLSKVIW